MLVAWYGQLARDPWHFGTGDEYAKMGVFVLLYLQLITTGPQ